MADSSTAVAQNSAPTDVSVLFTPFNHPKLQLKNRIVMAPMTRGFAPQGIVGQASADYYQRRAAADVGLILSEGTVINRPASRNAPGIPFFHGEQALAGWQAVIDAVHSAGGKMGPQLWHTGSTIARGVGDWAPPADVESPSGLLAPDKPRGKAMSEQDIADTIAAFAQAASDARRLGFDVVEIHGAHGYLIDQFFWSGTNQREDAYGGLNIRERSRFAAEIVTAMRAAVGPDYPLILRVSQWKQQDYEARLASSPQEMADWLQPLVAAGIDILHCSQRRFWEPEFPEQDGEQGLNFAGWAKKLTGVPTISVGSVGLSSDFISGFGGQAATATGLQRLVERMANDEFDLIAIGRALLQDPLWARKLHQGEDAALQDFQPAALSELY